MSGKPNSDSDFGEPVKFTRMGYLAVISQTLGYFFDAYDLLLILTLATVLNKVLLPPSVPPLISSITILSGFVLSEIIRPLGSAVFGNYADKLGRKSVIIITVVGYSAASALTAALPTYAQAGYLGFVLYLILRFFVGFFVGGEYAGGHALAMEWTPPKWRGLVGGLILAAFTFGSVLSSAVIYFFSTALGHNFILYGWRYIFLTVLAFIPVILVIRFKVEDSPQFKRIKSKGAIEKSPLSSVLKGPALKDFLQIMLLMTGMFLSSFASYSNLFILLQTKPSVIPYSSALLVYMIALVGGGIGSLLYGHLSQLFGRRSLGTKWPYSTIILSIPIYYLILHAAITYDMPLLFVLSFLLVFLAYAPWGSTIPYIAERYKTANRASGVGFGFSSGLFLGGWYTYYTLGLHYLFKPIEGPSIWLSSSVLLTIAAILVLVGFYLGPETRGVSLAE